MASLRSVVVALVGALVLGPRVARAQPATMELDLGGGTRLGVVLVRAGAFGQGSYPGEPGRSEDERARPVTISRDFYLGETLVQQAQYARFVEATGYRTEAERGTSGGYGLEGGRLVQRPVYHWRNPGFSQAGEHPAVLLTHDDATRFLEWLSARTGRRARLPTEAEWEYACRAGTTTPWYTGSTQADALRAGWFREGAGDGSRPVRGRTPNALGLHDMVGNAQQWVQDWYAPYEPGAVVDPVQAVPGSPPGEPARRVLRGGSWFRSLASGRCAARSRSTPGSRNPDLGFRVALDVAAPAPVPAPPGPAPTASGGDSTPAAPDDTWATLAVCGCGFGFFMTLVAGIVALVLRRGRGLRFVPQADGVRIWAAERYRGQTLHYCYRPPGRPSAEGWVVLDASPAGQFVYTGEAPTGFEMLGVLGWDRPTDARGRPLGRGRVDDTAYDPVAPVDHGGSGGGWGGPPPAY